MIDPTGVGNDACYVNHSCEPNCELREIYVAGRTVVALVALDDIPAFSELRCDYI